MYAVSIHSIATNHAVHDAAPVHTAIDVAAVVHIATSDVQIAPTWRRTIQVDPRKAVRVGRVRQCRGWTMASIVALLRHTDHVVIVVVVVEGQVVAAVVDTILIRPIVRAAVHRIDSISQE